MGGSDLYDRLLFGSQELTDEEEALRAEVAAWCREKLRAGARPIPVQCALRIMSDAVGSLSGEDLARIRDPRS